MGTFSIAQILLILGLNTCEFYVNSLTHHCTTSKMVLYIFRNSKSEFVLGGHTVYRASLARIRTFFGTTLVPYGPMYIALTHEGNKLAHFNGSQCSNTCKTCTVFSNIKHGIRSRIQPKFKRSKCLIIKPCNTNWWLIRLTFVVWQ